MSHAVNGPLSVSQNETSHTSWSLSETSFTPQSETSYSFHLSVKLHAFPVLKVKPHAPS
jgi:hypothetical protein